MSIQKNHYNILDNIIKMLQVPQVIYKKPKYEKAQMKPYTVEFTYFGRCLHSLGNNFVDMKIVDIEHPNFFNAVIYSILGHDKKDKITYKENNEQENMSYQEFCDKLNINVLVVGPDDMQYIIYNVNQNNKANNVDKANEEDKIKNPQAYVILYRSYDDKYYPIISLDKMENYLFYRSNSMILKQLISEE